MLLLIAIVRYLRVVLHVIVPKQWRGMCPLPTDFCLYSDYSFELFIVLYDVMMLIMAI
jgi:hypothetical protein